MNTVLAPPATLEQAAAELSAIEQVILRKRFLQHKNIPAVFHPLLKPSRYKGVYGGRGGGKSHVFAELLLARCYTKQTRAVCVREFQVTLEQSVKRLLEDKIEENALGAYFKIFNNYIETPKDGIIIFQGMQNHTAESIKSLEGYDVAWVEEAQSLSERSLTLLRPTIREPGSELWFSWNPRNITDPVDQLLRSENTPPDSIVVQSSYQDNPFFPDVLQKEMEWDRSRDIEKYDHVWLGGYEKHSESRVFKNWTIEDFETPSDASFLLGGDWGYSVDPACMVRCYPRERKLFIDAEAYQIGCEIDYLPTLFDGLVCGCVPEKDGTVLRPCRFPERHGSARQWVSIADSQRPDTISYMQRHGYPRMQAAVKGANSVKEGIIFLQGYDIVVHPRCTHTINELTHYSYVVDKLTGLVTPILEDKKNHVIDSLRYAVEKLRTPEVFVPKFVTW